MLREPSSAERPESAVSFESFRSGLAATEALMMSVLRAESMDDIGRMIGSMEQEGALCSVNGVVAGGRSPLHLAVAARRQDAVRYLLNQGALTEDADEEGHTALHYAVVDGQIELVKLLLDYGAHPFVEEPGTGMPAALDAKSDRMTRILPDACGKKLSTSVSPCPGFRPSCDGNESCSDDSLCDVLASPSAWTHYDSTGSSRPTSASTFRSRFPLRRPTPGRYVISEDVDRETSRSPSGGGFHSVAEDELVNLAETSLSSGESHTLPRAVVPALQRRTSCQERIENTSQANEQEEQAFTRNTTRSGSFRKYVDAAKKVFSHSLEDVARRRSFRRKRSQSKEERAPNGPTPKQQDIHEPSSARKLVPERDTPAVLAGLLARALSCTIMPQLTSAKSTAFQTAK